MAIATPAHRLPFREVGMLFSLAFLLNFFWEAWHAVYLYQGFDFTLPTQVTSLPDFVVMMTRVALIDALLIVGITGVQAVVSSDAAWFRSLSGRRVVLFAAMASVTAVVIEVKAVYIWHQWAYSSLMPTVFGLGVSPLLQLPLTGLLACWLVGQVRLASANAF